MFCCYAVKYARKVGREDVVCNRGTGEYEPVLEERADAFFVVLAQVREGNRLKCR
jgi:hypothetical protein